MDRTWARNRYHTHALEDLAEGWVALVLVRECDGTRQTAARITYWDAEGQYAFEMFGGELPLNILEEFVAEAKTLA